jgi:hypothetical protein
MQLLNFEHLLNAHVKTVPPEANQVAFFTQKPKQQANTTIGSTSFSHRKLSISDINLLNSIQISQIGLCQSPKL